MKPAESQSKEAQLAALTYYIVEGLLVGHVGSRFIHISAYSGGAGGSTKHRPEFTMNNPYMVGLKTVVGKAHQHGGPLPPGKYKIHKPAKHHHLGLSARLEHELVKPMGRDGFYIHCRGPHGSDGCIVPVNQREFQELMNALTASNGGTLMVAETHSDVRFA